MYNKPLHLGEQRPNASVLPHQSLYVLRPFLLNMLKVLLERQQNEVHNSAKYGSKITLLYHFLHANIMSAVRSERPTLQDGSWPCLAGGLKRSERPTLQDGSWPCLAGGGLKRSERDSPCKTAAGRAWLEEA